MSCSTSPKERRPTARLISKLHILLKYCLQDGCRPSASRERYQAISFGIHCGMSEALTGKITVCLHMPSSCSKVQRSPAMTVRVMKLRAIVLCKGTKMIGPAYVGKHVRNSAVYRIGGMCAEMGTFLQEKLDDLRLTFLDSCAKW